MQCSIKEQMTRNNRLKDEEGLFNELDTFFSVKEDLIAEGFYDKPALKAHFFRGGMKTQTDASRYVL